MSEPVSEPPAETRRVRFFYIKSQHFRVVHVDGALGGITPRGLIHFAIYSERSAIPQSVEQEISPEGRLGTPLSEEGKEGVVRELDADLLMTKQTAIELRDWLSGRIQQLESLEVKSRSNSSPKPSRKK